MGGQANMRSQCKIDLATKTAVITLAGPFVAEVVVDVAGSLYTNPEYQPELKVLFDARHLDMSATSQADMRALGQGLSELTRQHPAQHKVACVVANNLAYGIARMFELMHDDVLPYRLRTFRDHALAVQWLATGTAPLSEN